MSASHWGKKKDTNNGANFFGTTSNSGGLQRQREKFSISIYTSPKIRESEIPRKKRPVYPVNFLRKRLVTPDYFHVLQVPGDTKDGEDNIHLVICVFLDILFCPFLSCSPNFYFSFWPERHFPSSSTMMMIKTDSNSFSSLFFLLPPFPAR